MEEPVLPLILPYIKGKKLVCCESAWNHFMEIVQISAGKKEWARAMALEKRLKIVPDMISARTKRLTGKAVSHINQSVFGTGDSLHVLTVTAIASFLRRAEQQGIQYYSFIHSVRPLMERYQMEYENKRLIDEKNEAEATAAALLARAEADAKEEEEVEEIVP